jgi:L-ascorbate metabolism protein UlaG (beta-lactamase superfamily)
MTTLKFYGHACFQLENDRHSLLFDPFLKENPFQVQQPEAINCNYILVSHAHYDHLGDTVAIAKRTGATVISTAEIANFCSEQGCSSHAMHIGGKHAFDFGYVRVALAFHGSGIAGGHACGFVINIGGKTVYFAGDTGLFGDMALLGQLEKIDYALLPIGDNFTMGPDDAVEAVAMLKPRFVIPMHYDTWPLIAQSADKFKENVEKRLNIPVVILKPGENLDLI